MIPVRKKLPNERLLNRSAWLAGKPDFRGGVYVLLALLFFISYFSHVHKVTFSLSYWGECVMVSLCVCSLYV
jgi:hypothetical protein